LVFKAVTLNSIQSSFDFFIASDVGLSKFESNHFIHEYTSEAFNHVVVKAQVADISSLKSTHTVDARPAIHQNH